MPSELPNCFASGECLNGQHAAENSCHDCPHATKCFEISKKTAELSSSLDEWLQFEERSGWTLKEFCRTKDPMAELHRLRGAAEVWVVSHDGDPEHLCGDLVFMDFRSAEKYCQARNKECLKNRSVGSAPYHVFSARVVMGEVHREAADEFRAITDPEGPIYKDAMRRLADTTFPPRPKGKRKP